MRSISRHTREIRFRWTLAGCLVVCCAFSAGCSREEGSLLPHDAQILRPLSLLGQTDFLVLLDWGGFNVQPFPRGVLVPRGVGCPYDDPFSYCARIGQDELDAMLREMDNSAVVLSTGPYEDGKEEYFMEIRAGIARAHTPLPVSNRSVMLLEKLSACLAEDNRMPVIAVRATIEGLTPMAAQPALEARCSGPRVP